MITRHLLGQAGLKADRADSGAVTLIQRFGSAANLNIHLHCLVLDGVYRRGADGVPEFVEVPAPTAEALQAAAAPGVSPRADQRLRLALAAGLLRATGRPAPPLPPAVGATRLRQARRGR